jgi:hypothetical protein
MELSHTMIADLERMAHVLLCKLEKIFPPGLCNSMQHWILHLLYESTNEKAHEGTLVLSNRDMSKGYSKEM